VLAFSRVKRGYSGARSIGKQLPMLLAPGVHEEMHSWKAPSLLVVQILSKLLKASGAQRALHTFNSQTPPFANHLVLGASKKLVQSLSCRRLIFRGIDCIAFLYVHRIASLLGDQVRNICGQLLPHFPAFRTPKSLQKADVISVLAGHDAAAASHAHGCGCWEGRRQSARASRAAWGRPRRGALPEEEEPAAVQRQAALHEVSLSTCSGLCEGYRCCYQMSFPSS
jgi:hypothetical protein